MTRTIRFATLLLLVGSIAAQTTFRLVAPDKSFEISFPVQPKHEQNSSDAGAVHVQAHSYSCESSAWKYILSYVQLDPPPADLKPSDALESAVSGTADNVGGRIVTQKWIAVRGQPAKAVTMSVGSKTVLDGRFVYLKPRLYQLLVLHDKGSEPAFEHEFFDSFVMHINRER